MTRLQKTIKWLPRVMSIAFVLFMSIFALDVFDQASGWSVVLALFMHLLPSLVLFVCIGFAWRYELVGAVSFFVFAAGYIGIVGFDRPWGWYATIAGPATIVGVLFFISWTQKKRIMIKGIPN